MTARARTATVLSHQRPGQTADALRMLIEAAEREGVEKVFARTKCPSSSTATQSVHVPPMSIAIEYVIGLRCSTC